MAELTAAGFSIRTYAEIYEAIETEFRSNVSESLDTSTESPLGQFIGIVSRQIRSLEELALAVYSSQYPAGANGFSLHNVGALTGSKPNAATFSETLATVNVAPGTYAAGSLVAFVDGAPTARFENVTAVSNVAMVAGNYSVRFKAQTAGPVRANAGTLTEIAEAVSGWNSITNAEDATQGKNAETDTEFRLRREQEVAATGSTTVDAIRADVLRVDGVTYARVFENDQGEVVGDMPAHSFEAVVIGGENADIASAIFLAKPGGGGESVGDVAVSVTDSQGEAHLVRFSRPEDLNIYVTADLRVNPATYAGNTETRQFLADLAALTFGVGVDVVRARLVSALMSAPGVEDVVALTLGFAPAPVGTSNLPILSKQIADFDTSRITITSSTFTDA